ncbi:MAG: hypothetical protein AB1489_01145 [Acidobacteriota bacterium]
MVVKRVYLVFCFLGLIINGSIVTAGPFPQASRTQGLPTVGPVVTTISSLYYEPRRDPFRDVVKRPDTVVTVLKPTELPWPSYQEREYEWKKRRDIARQEGKIVPRTSERYLIGEVEVLGYYQKPAGPGVFLKPKTTTSTMIFASVGEKFYNGSIRKIESRQGIIEFDKIVRLSSGAIKHEKQIIHFKPGH